jgi:hypothetical protein
MAVPIEGYSVIVRITTLTAKYPGGMQGYHAICPNATFCADTYVSRIAFMVQGDADLFVAHLAEQGLTPSRQGAAEDVAMVHQEKYCLPPCDWLELGTWQGTTIAWLAGTHPGDVVAPSGWTPERHVQLLSAEEFRARLEFVRTEGQVDVYRDKTSEQEFHVGRTEFTSPQDKIRHDQLYQQASTLIDGLIILSNEAPAPLERQQHLRLEQAIPLFEEVVRLDPHNWAAMWLLGKIYQRLVNHEQSLNWFARAHRVNPDQVDVAREASVAAMELGRPVEAIPFCECAIEINPDDPGLRANHALALLFAERPTEARGAAEEALRRDPADEVTAQIVRFIGEVLDGKRPCPHHARDLQ